jgi:hypothetical protein
MTGNNVPCISSLVTLQWICPNRIRLRMQVKERIAALERSPTSDVHLDVLADQSRPNLIYDLLRCVSVFQVFLREKISLRQGERKKRICSNCCVLAYPPTRSYACPSHSCATASATDCQCASAALNFDNL